MPIPTPEARRLLKMKQASLAKALKSQTKSLTQRGEDLSTRKFSRKVIEKLAPALGMSFTEKAAVYSEEDPIGALREKYEFSPLHALYITTEKMDAVKVLRGGYKRSPVWKLFLELLKDHECPVLVFNLSGAGLTVLTRFSREGSVPGDVRIQISAKETAIDAYMLQFATYLEFIKNYGKDC